MEDNIKWDSLYAWLHKSSKVLIKKLSRNDCSWADDATKHQNGFYVPSEIRNSNYFPNLVQSTKPGKGHIFRANFPTYWPSLDITKYSWLRHFSNKGSETHLTGIPKIEFQGLTPASLLVGGVLKSPINASVYHWFVVVDSASHEAELLETIFDLKVNFEFGIFKPEDLSLLEYNSSQLLIDELSLVLKNESLWEFLKNNSILPKPGVIAKRAQDLYLADTGATMLNPYEVASPGDAIMKISRDIEFTLYKEFELRHRAADVINILTSNGSDLVTAVVKGFPQLNASFLSASQHRKSRAGRSFEYHISRLLKDGGICFEEQYVTGGRRPDFVMPSGVRLNDKSRLYEEALVLSAKTTLRERWKQLALERFECKLFLATVDDRISSDAIGEMSKADITLVVPESLKVSKDTCYSKKENVLSFRSFFDDEIRGKRNFLITT